MVGLSHHLEDNYPKHYAMTDNVQNLQTLSSYVLPLLVPMPAIC